MKRILGFKKISIIVFLLLATASILLLGHLKFSFDFSAFFPEGDDDLLFYQDFSKEFGTDDNFLLVAIVKEPSVFEKDFLARFQKFSEDAKNFPNVIESQSLTTLSYPLKTSFGYIQLPIIHSDDPTKYESDRQKIKADAIFTNALIDTEATSLVVAIETQDDLDYEQSVSLLNEVRKSLAQHQLKNYHLLGRTFFYEALVQMQKREILITSITSTVLVFLILIFVYRKIVIVGITLGSITIAFLLFLGLLAILGKELNAIAAFYPILMLIVGTSDVIHIMDHYLEKIKKGSATTPAMLETLKTVGLSTLLTSVTTAVGFASLLTSKSSSIADFGINAALGVLVAYLTVIFFTSALLLLTPTSYLISAKSSNNHWNGLFMAINRLTIKKPNTILLGSFLFIGISIFGVTHIDTNYQFKESLPKGSKIAADFTFFQKNYAGFRPLEIAIMAKNGTKVTDFEVVQEIDKLEKKLDQINVIQNIQSITLIYKSLHKANHLNKTAYFKLPEDIKTYTSYRAEAKKLGRRRLDKFVNATETKARIQAKILDIGTDSLADIYAGIKGYIKTQTDTSLVNFRLTGKGLLLDKNAFYIRDSLLQGLVIALIIISILMALLFKNIKLVVISLIPNMLPLLFAGALLGFLHIPLEASISIVFAIVFGIAVDDTIHFLSKFKLYRAQGMNQETALQETFKKTGKALTITTLLLFFGFLTMVFSVHQPSRTVGLLISITLVTALIFDLLLIPVLIRKLLRRL